MISKIWPAKLVKFRLEKNLTFQKFQLRENDKIFVQQKFNAYRTVHGRQTHDWERSLGAPNNNNNREQEDRNFKYPIYEIIIKTQTRSLKAHFRAVWVPVINNKVHKECRREPRLKISYLHIELLVHFFKKKLRKKTTKSSNPIGLGKKKKKLQAYKQPYYSAEH